MKALIAVLVAVAAMAGGLVTGEKMKFVPGDKVLFFEDFNKCPIGEIPQSFDKVDGVGECVKLDNNIWFASARNHALLFKDINLTGKEFSIEYDVYFLTPHCHGIDLHYYKKPGGKDEIEKMKTWVGPGCSGEGFHIGVAKVGDLFQTKYRSPKKKRHIAIQYRRGLYRIFFDGKRIASFPANDFKQIGSIMFELVGDYSHLIDNIKIATYSSKEKAPKPEKLGIEVKKIKRDLLLRVPAKILFDFNSYILKPQAKEALGAIVYMIQKYPDRKVAITGYTDNVGSDEYNLKLSLQRAQAVADYLIYCAKIDPKRIKIEGKGKADPVADNSTKEGRAKNRRVEVVLLK